MGEGGAVLFISSVHANQCIPNRILYSMTKAAINALNNGLGLQAVPPGNSITFSTHISYLK